MSPEGRPRLTWSSRKSAIPSPPGRLTGGIPSGAEADDSCPTLIEGDNLPVLSALAAQQPGSVHLAYLDPPFLTGRAHFKVTRSKTKNGEVERTEKPAFDDRWGSLSDYLSSVEQRVAIIRDLLAPEGSLVLHVDPKTSHYLKVICDEVFGIESFASEIIWRYRRWPSKTKNFQRVHDVMLRYVKEPSSNPRFNQLYEPLAPSTQKTWGDRKQKAVTNASGRRVRSSKTDEKSQGTPLGDVWEIGIVAPVAKERTGYPTQKPEALLRRWIQACTDEGDLVLDPYMGSGTTLRVAHELGRRSVGIDLGAESHDVVRSRLTQAGVAFWERKLIDPMAKATPRANPSLAQDAS